MCAGCWHSSELQSLFQTLTERCSSSTKHHRTAPERTSKLVPPEAVLTSDLLGAAGDKYLWLSESTDLGVSTHEHIHIEDQSHMFAVVDKNLAITTIQISNHEIKTLNLILQPVKSTIKNKRISNHYKWSNNIFWFFSYVCNKYQQFIVKKVLRKPFQVPLRSYI